MPHNFDVRNFTDERREQLAWAIHESSDFKLPALRAWNYEPCRQHRYGWDKEVQNESGLWVFQKQFTPKPDCRKCGIIFREHQRIGIAWMYMKKFGLLADSMGLGKTTEIGGLIAMLLETGELSLARDRSDPFGGMGRAIVVPRSTALYQWHNELLRMMPGLNIAVSEGSKRQRTQLYLQPWQVLLIGPDDPEGLRDAGALRPLTSRNR